MVIAQIEDALTFARENACHSVCVFLMGRNGVNTTMLSLKSRTEAVGALAILQHEIMASD